MSEMAPRERVIATFSLRQPDRVPKDVTFTPSILEMFREKIGDQDPLDYFDCEMRHVEFRPPKEKPDFSSYLPPDLPQDTIINEWGRTRVPGPYYHFTEEVYPMANMTSPDELDDYPFPDYTLPYRSEGVKEEIDRLHELGFFVLGGGGSIFEISWWLTGMEKMFVDWATAPEFAEKLLDTVTEIRVHQTVKMVQAGVDGIPMGDDVGTQRGMLMSPDTWRKWLKPRMTRVIQAARAINPDILVTYHSDGYIEPIIPDFIEIGINVLNPVQPECTDPAKLKGEYGDRLAFWGTISIQRTMPFGTPDDVASEVRERIETVGKGGGLLIAPTHALQPEVPWENILAFFDAVEEYGGYD